MKQIYSLFTVLFLLSILLFSCSEENEEGCDIIKSAENNKYSVVIDSGSSAESRAITDLVQGGGNYSEGSLVKLYTKDRKFMATAVGSAGTTWLQNGDPNSTTILTSSINQDWSVAIKYYSDVILDCTAPGGDGSKVTKALEVGSQLPDPVVTAGYTFEGWYEGGTRVYIVPESSNRTFTAKFKAIFVEKTIIISTKSTDTHFSGDGFASWEYTTKINASTPTELIIIGIEDYQSNASGGYTNNVSIRVSNTISGSWTNEENIPYGDENSQGYYVSTYHLTHYTLTINSVKVEDNASFGYSTIESYRGEKVYTIGNIKYKVIFQ